MYILFAILCSHIETSEREKNYKYVVIKNQWNSQNCFKN